MKELSERKKKRKGINRKKEIRRILRKEQEKGGKERGLKEQMWN
jgi:hypothetical protein